MREPSETDSSYTTRWDSTGDLIKRDAKSFRFEQLLRGPKHPLTIAARVSSQLSVTAVSV